MGLTWRFSVCQQLHKALSDACRKRRRAAGPSEGPNPLSPTPPAFLHTDPDLFTFLVAPVQLVSLLLIQLLVDAVSHGAQLRPACPPSTLPVTPVLSEIGHFLWFSGSGSSTLFISSSSCCFSSVSSSRSSALLGAYAHQSAAT